MLTKQKMEHIKHIKNNTGKRRGTRRVNKRKKEKRKKEKRKPITSWEKTKKTENE